MTGNWITLVILAYDRPEIMDRTVRSLAARLPEDVQLLLSVNEKPSKVESVWGAAKRLRGEVQVDIVRTGSQLSMKEHFNWACKQVKTPYFLLLGDDDGVAPDFLNLGREIIDTHGTAVIRCRDAHAVLEDLGESLPEGTIAVEKGATGQLSQVSALDLLRRQSAKFEWTSNMQTIIPMDLIQRINRRCGSWCWGFCPDLTGGRLMLAELAVAQDVTYWELDAPWTLSGYSPHSNAASVMFGGKTGRSKEFSQELGEREIQFPDWVKHRVSVGTTSDMIKIEEMIRYYYPGLLEMNDTPNPDGFMPALLADAFPFQADVCSMKAPFPWCEGKPIGVLLGKETADRYGRQRTIRWLMSASFIWGVRLLTRAKFTLKEKGKLLVPTGLRPAVSRIRYPISRREIIWSPNPQLGLWGSPQFSRMYLASAADVASMPWVNDGDLLPNL